ncbi:MAG TPA: adenylosuccinate lyase, partial [bacterium]|nr:adenylosuccinate lyase [bacterium]
ALQSVSPLDGRYEKSTEPLGQFFSEYALISYRYRVEVAYLQALFPVVHVKFSRKVFKTVSAELTLADAKRVKKIEEKTNHDVKAVEYLLREKLDNAGLGHLKQWTHFALTSEDVNNLAYGLMIRDALTAVILPRMEELVGVIERLAEKHARDVMLARTHGQPASPTTFGKEMAVFVHRLSSHLDEITRTPICGKLAGATGNYNAHQVAFPDVDWPVFAREFVESLGLEHNPLVTQIENHDSWAQLFHAIVRFNTVLIGFNQDIWRYISDGWLGQKPKAGEVGSSTMPHKVNPINFENSEGNLQLANEGLKFLADKLLISRMQRDLTDSTVQRNIGSYLAYCLLGYDNCLKGLQKIKVNTAVMREIVQAHPEVLAEAIQTILRREGDEQAYEKLKELTRGGSVTMASLHAWIEGLSVSAPVKKELKSLSPDRYIGLAETLAGCEEG